MTQSGADRETPLPRIVSVVGLKKTGKTTVVTALLSELRSRGYRVGSIKTTEHDGLFLDQEGTDTRRHADAGAEVVVALLPGETVRFERFPPDTGFIVSEGMAYRSASPLVVLCLRRIDELAETLAVRGIEPGEVLAVSGVAAAGTHEGGLPGSRGLPFPVFDATDAVQRKALADLIIKKAYPGA